MEHSKARAYAASQPRSQKQQILQALKRGPLTAMSALSLFGCFRLAARVAELRGEGHQIHTTRRGKARFAVYRLVRSNR